VKAVPPVPEENHDDQFERTLLAWRRTALSLVAAGLLVAHLAAENLGRGVLAPTLTGTAVVVGFVWLSSHGRAAPAGIGLVLGVLLLGAVALLGIVTS
jgi:uncharacterized membrane protein YidH (DUF202 family)